MELCEVALGAVCRCVLAAGVAAGAVWGRLVAALLPAVVEASAGGPLPRWEECEELCRADVEDWLGLADGAGSRELPVEGLSCVPDRADAEKLPAI